MDAAGCPSRCPRAAQRPAAERLLAEWDTALQIDSDRGETRRPHLPRFDLHARPAQLALGGVQGCVGHLRIEAVPGAVVAAAARSGLLVVQLAPQELHAAFRRRRVVAHRLLLGRPLPRHPRVPLRVVDPGPAGALPAALHPVHRAVHVEHLEHRLQPGPAQLHQGLERGQGHRSARLREHVDRAAHLLLGREGHRGEIAPDRLVLLPGKQKHLRVLHTSPGPADLLVVRDRGGG